MAIRLATATRNALANAFVTQADSGTGAATVKIYTGTQPASANDAIGGATLLVTFTLSDPSFGAASAGAVTLAGTPKSASAVATGTAGWFRLETSTPGTVIDGSVTATGGGGDMTVDNTSITSGQTVNLTGGTVTMPSGE